MNFIHLACRPCLSIAAAMLIGAWALGPAWALSPTDVATAIGPAAADSPTETPRLTAQASASTVQVAEPFELQLTVTAPAGSQVTFPAAGQSIGPFDIVDTQDTLDVPLGQAGTDRTWTRRLQLESLVSGPLQIPALEIRVVVPDGAEPHVLRAAPIDVRVRSVLEDRADPRQFRDIESVVDVAIPDSNAVVWPWWTAGGIAVVAAAAAGMLIVRRRRTLTPAQWALQRIGELQSAVGSGEIDSDAALRELSDVLHHYLHSAPQPSATAGTLVELIEEAERRGEIDSAAAQPILAAWSLADKAKYAGWQLSTEQLQTVIAETGHWIETQSERD